MASECPNCNGVKCMDCRTRTLHDACRHDCPECCDPFNENDAIEFTRYCRATSQQGDGQ